MFYLRFSPSLFDDFTEGRHKVRAVITDHHMFPRARFPELAKERWNIKRIPDKEHEAWHRVFNDKTPDEAVIHILKFWTPQEMRREILLKVLKEEQ